MNRISIRLFTLLFSITVCTTVIPCGIVNTHGLFGEVQSFTAAEEQTKQEETAAQKTKTFKTKNALLFNCWFILLCTIICLIAAIYTTKLPDGKTIVTLKIRMNN